MPATMPDQQSLTQLKKKKKEEGKKYENLIETSPDRIRKEGHADIPNCLFIFFPFFFPTRPILVYIVSDPDVQYTGTSIARPWGKIAHKNP
jgi:hypothetical protein